MVKIEIRRVAKDKVKDFVEAEVLDIPNKRAFNNKLKELRRENYVLEYQNVEGKQDTLEMNRDAAAGMVVL